MKVEDAIQAKWEIEEKVIIFLIEFRLNPPSAPIEQEAKIRIVKIRVSLEENIRAIGAIFCQVNKITPLVQLINSMTWGNQEWVGAIPILIPRDTEIKLLRGVIKLTEEDLINSSPDRMIKTEARAWVIKYLMAASELEGDWCIKIIGMNAIRLTSKANQAITQEEEEHAIIVLTARIREIIKK
jgi:hypothetical protein